MQPVHPLLWYPPLTLRWILKGDLKAFQHWHVPLRKTYFLIYKKSWKCSQGSENSLKIKILGKVLGDIQPSWIITIHTELEKFGEAGKFIYQFVEFTVNAEYSDFPTETVFIESLTIISLAVCFTLLSLL